MYHAIKLAIIENKINKNKNKLQNKVNMVILADHLFFFNTSPPMII